MNLRVTGRPLLWVGVLSFALSGCYTSSWRPIPPPYDRSLDALGAPEVARVSTADTTVVLRQPVATADSIWGTTDSAQIRYSVPIEAIQAVELRALPEYNSGVAMLTFVGGIVLVAAWCASTACTGN